MCNAAELDVTFRFQRHRFLLFKPTLYVGFLSWLFLHNFPILTWIYTSFFFQFLSFAALQVIEPAFLAPERCCFKDFCLEVPHSVQAEMTFADIVKLYFERILTVYLSCTLMPGYVVHQS